MKVTMQADAKASTTPRERPILFSGSMVAAILAGRKTQTRRVVKPQPPTPERFRGASFALSRAVADGVKMYSQNDWERLPKHRTDWDLIGSVGVARDAGFPMRYRCPYGQPGDRLWVRETFQPLWEEVDEPGDWKTGAGFYVSYPATDGVVEWHDEDKGLTTRCRPSIHMPRWASRITLEVVSVRVERLQGLSEEDAKAEGVEPFEGRGWRNYLGPEPLQAIVGHARAVDSFASLWDSLNGDKPGFAWADSPWVWVVEFKRVAA